MATTTTDERLAEIHRQIRGLQVRAEGVGGAIRLEIERRVDALREEEAAARAAVRQAGGVADDRLRELEAKLAIAEHSAAVELADDRAAFLAAVQAALRAWDTYVERLQTKAAARRGSARDEAEAAVGELRRLRNALAQAAAAAGPADGERWRAARSRFAREQAGLGRRVDELSAALARDDEA